MTEHTLLGLVEEADTRDVAEAQYADAIPIAHAAGYNRANGIRGMQLVREVRLLIEQGMSPGPAVQFVSSRRGVRRSYLAAVALEEGEWIPLPEEPECEVVPLRRIPK